MFFFTTSFARTLDQSIADLHKLDYGILLGKNVKQMPGKFKTY